MIYTSSLRSTDVGTHIATLHHPGEMSSEEGAAQEEIREKTANSVLKPPV